jgi:hypothetical protein
VREPAASGHDTFEHASSLLDASEAVPAQNEFRVKFRAGPGGDRFFPRHRHAPRDSAMVVGCTTREEFKGRSTLLVGDRAVDCYVEAKLVPYRDSRGDRQLRIVSLVFI